MCRGIRGQEDGRSLQVRIVATALVGRHTQVSGLELWILVAWAPETTRADTVDPDAAPCPGRAKIFRKVNDSGLGDTVGNRITRHARVFIDVGIGRHRSVYRTERNAAALALLQHLAAG